MDAIEKENPSLKGVLPKVYARQNLDPTSLGELIDLIGSIALGHTKARSADVLGHVFEYFLGEFALAEGKKGGQFYIPRSVVELLVEMLEPYQGRVFDPCCGSGGMFVQSEKFVTEHQGRSNDISIYGQESNQTTWRLCKMNLSIRGIDSSQVKWNNEGSFLNDAHKDLKADFIIANPPFNVSDWGGEFRTSQNWIGGTSLHDAVFIPPSHHLVNELMSDLEKFLNNDEINVPLLIRIAIAHYQFETIHPFLDGNGRIGRLMITLFLVSEGILDKPLLYPSLYFEKNKSLYYDNLSNVRTKNDMLQWIKYFLIGIEQSAAKAVETLSNILKLKESIEKEINSNFGRRSNSAHTLVHFLFKDPVISIDKAAKECNLSFKAANDLVALMQKSNYLKELTKQSRNRIFIFESYLKIFDND